MGLVDRLEDLDGALPGRLVALLDGQARPQLALDVADVARREEQVAAAHAQVEVALLLGGEADPQLRGPLFRTHDRPS